MVMHFFLGQKAWFAYLRLLLLGLVSFLPLFAYSKPSAICDGSEPPPLASNYSGKLLCTINGQSFIDNTEYFNKIMEGETLFGFHFLPGLTFLMAEEIGLNLGLIWEKHFGHMQPWFGIRPALSIYYSHKQTSCVLGIFDLQDYPPTLLEPLYVRRKPFMEGFHFKLAKHKSYLSGWLNWRTLLAKQDNQPETFTLYLDGAWCQDHSSQKISCTIPFQLAVYHLGGQGISVKDYSLWCGAGGLSLRLPNSFSGPIYGASYLLFNKYVKEIDRPFKAGWGQLHTIDWRMNFLGVSLSYWYGYHFSSENMGHLLYQSMRIENHKAIYYEPIRSLLFLSIYRDWVLQSGITLQVVLRPYYDFSNRLLEYGFSCKLVYSRKVQLTTLRYVDVPMSKA